MKGVISSKVGFAGGTSLNPTYKEVCTGSSGHAEVVQVRYDPLKVSYRELLDAIFRIHNPTIPPSYCGGQYRSVVFFHSEEQKRVAIDLLDELRRISPRPVMTELAPCPIFYLAEDYHQSYYKKSGKERVCRF